MKTIRFGGLFYWEKRQMKAGKAVCFVLKNKRMGRNWPLRRLVLTKGSSFAERGERASAADFDRKRSSRSYGEGRCLRAAFCPRRSVLHSRVVQPRDKAAAPLMSMASAPKEAAFW